MAIDWSKTALPTTEGGYDSLSTEDKSGLRTWLEGDAPERKLLRLCLAKETLADTNAKVTSDTAAVAGTVADL